MEESAVRRVLNNRPIITGARILVFQGNGITAPQLQARPGMVKTAKAHASFLANITGAKLPTAGTIVLLCQQLQLMKFDGRLV